MTFFYSFFEILDIVQVYFFVLLCEYRNEIVFWEWIYVLILLIKTLDVSNDDWHRRI